MKKNTLKNNIRILIFSILILFCFSINVYGASYSIAANTSIEVGNTFNLSISSGDVTGRLNVSSSNGGVVSIISDSKAWVEKNTVTVSLKANSVGTAVITVTPATLADDKGEVHLGSKSITITVKEKPVTPPPPPVNNGNDGNSNTSAKSSNNYLKNLKVNVEGLSPRFSKTTLNYALTVGKDVSNININASPEDFKSRVSISGNNNLSDGNNTITITVTAENGNKRYYKITVTKVVDISKSNAFLDNLVIQGIILDPGFQSEMLEYNLGKVASDFTSFNILTFPKDEGAKVEIIGNENLKSGKNTIKIKVTAPDGITIKEYILSYEKEEGPEVIAEENSLISLEKASNDNFIKRTWRKIKNNSLIVLMYLFILVEFAQILYLYIKLRKMTPKKSLDIKDNMKNRKNGPKKEIKTKDNMLNEEIENLKGLKENPRVELKTRSALKNGNDNK